MQEPPGIASDANEEMAYYLHRLHRWTMENEERTYRAHRQRALLSLMLKLLVIGALWLVFVQPPAGWSAWLITLVILFAATQIAAAIRGAL